MERTTKCKYKCKYITLHWDPGDTKRFVKMQYIYMYIYFFFYLNIVQIHVHVRMLRLVLYHIECSKWKKSKFSHLFGRLTWHCNVLSTIFFIISPLHLNKILLICSEHKDCTYDLMTVLWILNLAPKMGLKMYGILVFVNGKTHARRLYKYKNRSVEIN